MYLLHVHACFYGVDIDSMVGTYFMVYVAISMARLWLSAAVTSAVLLAEGVHYYKSP